MYRTCIFCSADLGSNDSIEHFPVGSRIAFDAARGRLWAVCPRCARWNLAPIEERWEAVEDAEKLFGSSRLRVQNENIGLSVLPDGTHAVRIGAALEGEVAAWRYGREFRRRRMKMWAYAAAGSGALGAFMLGAPLLVSLAAPATLGYQGYVIANAVRTHMRGRRIVSVVPSYASPTGEVLPVRRRDLNRAVLSRAGGETTVVLSGASRRSLRPMFEIDDTPPPVLLQLRGTDATRLMARAMVDFNSSGASKNELTQALDLLNSAGSAVSYLEDFASRDIPLKIIQGSGSWWNSGRVTMDGLREPRADDGDLSYYGYRSALNMNMSKLVGVPRVLALEMALHEESERRALQGELEDLEEAWREAESIARIADALPDEAPE
jgi:hypothetical protein